jgi:hypothetical protein
MFDVKYVEPREMNQSDRKSLIRPVIKYAIEKLRKTGKHATQEDPDYFFKKLMPSQYENFLRVMDNINSKIYAKSVYSGDWLISKFGLKPGPQIGKVLKAMSDKFGKELSDTPEDEVANFVKSIL